MVYLRYHLPSGLIALPMIGFLLELLYHSFPGGPVLQSKFRHDSAKLVRLRVLHPVQRYAEPQDEFAKAIYDTPVHDAQNDYPFGAIGEEIGHPVAHKRNGVYAPFKKLWRFRAK